MKTSNRFLGLITIAFVIVSSATCVAGDTPQLKPFLAFEEIMAAQRERLHDTDPSVELTLGKKSALDALGVDLGNVKEINLFTLNPMVGDNMIFLYSQLDYLHSKYPNAVIKVISHTSNLLQPKSWLKPVSFDTKQFLSQPPGNPAIENPKALADLAVDVLERNVSRGSVTFVDGGSLQMMVENWVPFSAFAQTYQQLSPFASAKEKQYRSYLEDQRLDFISSMYKLQKRRLPDVLNRQGSIGVFVMPNATFQMQLRHRSKYSPSNERGFGISAYFPQDPLSDSIRPTATVPILSSTTERPMLDAGAGKNVHIHTEYNARLLFGDDFRIKYDPSIFVDDGATIVPWQEFLTKSFAKPENPYRIINLNTFGTSKVKESEFSYASTLERLINDLKGQFPNDNILYSEIEPQYSDRVRGEVARLTERLQKRYPGKIAPMPADKGLWPRSISGARAIISQDSGFVHVSNAILGPERVMSVSLADSPDTRWTMPGQLMRPIRNSYTECRRLFEALAKIQD